MHAACRRWRRSPRLARQARGHLRRCAGSGRRRDFCRAACAIAANLPYNVGTALLIKWLTAEHWPPIWASLTLMFQREVAERITARPGSEHYGRLSVLAAWRTKAKILFDVNRSAFVPPPSVTSSIVRLEPLPEPVAPAELKKLERVTAAAFGQRRKMLRQSLKPLGGEALLEKAGIDPTARPEQLGVARICSPGENICPASSAAPDAERIAPGRAGARGGFAPPAISPQACLAHAGYRRSAPDSHTPPSG